MRKLNVAIIALFFGLSFASCKTEYECGCGDGNSYTKKHSSKSEAQSWCEGKEGTYEVNGTEVQYECTVSEK